MVSKEIPERTIPEYEHLFNRNKNSKKAAFNVLKYLYKENKRPFWIMFLLFAIKDLPVYLAPLILSSVIDVVTNPSQHSVTTIYIYGLILVISAVQNFFTHRKFADYRSKTVRTISAGFRNTMVRRLHQLSINFHNEQQSGKLNAKFLRDIESVEMLIDHVLSTLLPAVIRIVVTLTIAVYKSWIIAACFLVVVPFTVFVSNYFKDKLRKNNHDLRTETESLSANVTEMLEVMPVTKAHGVEDAEISKVTKNINKLVSAAYKVDMTNAVLESALWITVQCFSALSLVFTGVMAFYGFITPGAVALFQTYFTSLTSTLQMFLNIFPFLTRGIESLSSISEIMLSDQVENNKNKIVLRNLNGSVHFQNVSYKYPNSADFTIKNFSMSADPGDCVALVGSSGSGKTTIMNMIIGFLRASHGTVLIDGKPIQHLNLTEYRKYISVVPQTSVLFTGTIRENIVFGMEGVSEEQLEKVIEQANLKEFIDSLPLGLDTPVSEHGANFSGGQKQRISIARALIRDPRIIILDEATSALDNISEYQVQQAMNELIKGRTTFIVAHRLSTIRNANKIIVMEQGKMVETGTYKELMDKKGKFYELKILSEFTEKSEE